MLPETIAMRDSYIDARSLCRITTPYKTTLVWISDGSKVACPVFYTELLHLCWLAEETIAPIDEIEEYENEIASSNGWRMYHASWQQRTIALCKVKGIEIV